MNETGDAWKPLSAEGHLAFTQNITRREARLQLQESLKQRQARPSYMDQVANTLQGLRWARRALFVIAYRRGKKRHLKLVKRNKQAARRARKVTLGAGRHG